MTEDRIAILSNTNPPYVINTRVENFVYYPDPSQMTDEAIEREMPRARWLPEMSNLASLLSPIHEQIEPIPIDPDFAEMVAK